MSEAHGDAYTHAAYDVGITLSCTKDALMPCVYTIGTESQLTVQHAQVNYSV